MRRLFFFLLLGILLCADRKKKNRRNETSKERDRVKKVELYRAPAFLLPLHGTYGGTGMKDGGRGETERKHTHPYVTHMHVHDSPVRWLNKSWATYWLYVMQPLHQRTSKKGEEREREWSVGLQSATPPFLDHLEILFDSCTCQQRRTCSNIFFSILSSLFFSLLQSVL